jgi:MFS family permease
MCFVVVLLDGFDTAAIGFIAPSLITEWNISKPELAPVLSAALFGLAFGALMVFKLGIEAQKHWRRLNGSALLPKVVTGVQFIDGEELKEQAA